MMENSFDTMIALEREKLEAIRSLERYTWDMDYSDEFLGIHRVHVYLNEYGLPVSLIEELEFLGYSFFYVAKQTITRKNRGKYYAVFRRTYEEREAGF